MELAQGDTGEAPAEPDEKGSKSSYSSKGEGKGGVDRHNLNKIFTVKISLICWIE